MNSASQDKKRLFIGIPLEAFVAEELAEVQKKNSSLWGIKWVPKENMHITTFFIGDYPAGNIEELIDSLEQEISSLGIFTLELEAIKVMPPGNRARMIWASFKKDVVFEELVSRCSNVLNTLAGIKADYHDPIAHITLARLKQFKAVDLLDLEVNLSFDSIICSSYVLYESQLRPEGPIYSTVHKWDFLE